MTQSDKVLFVCIENAGRSQIAEAFFRKYAPQFEVMSAGTQPSSQLNPIVVQVMEEIGIDISTQKPKELTNDMISQSTPINMGCIERKSCPALFLSNVIDWNIPDPKNKEIEHVRKIRDEIKNNVLELIKKLEEKY